MTSEGGVTNLSSVPLVTRGSCDTSLNIVTGATSTSRRTLVAVTVVTTVGASTVVDPCVDATRESTNLSNTRGASTRVRATDIALVTRTAIATGGSLPGVLCRGTGAATGLEVSTCDTALGVAWSTSIAVSNTALTVVITVGTFAGADEVSPATIVLTGLHVRLTAVLVTNLLTTCIGRLVVGVVSTVAVGLATLRVTTGTTVVLGGPDVESAVAIVLTDLSLTTATTFAVQRTLVAVAILTTHSRGTGLCRRVGGTS